MIEAFEIGTEIKLTSNVAEVLEKLIRQFDELSELVEKSTAALAGFAKDIGSLGRSGRQISAISQALDKISNTKLGSATGDEMERMAEASRSTLDSSERLGEVLRQNARAAAETAEAMTKVGRGTRDAATAEAAQARRKKAGPAINAHEMLDLGIGAGMIGAPMLETYYKSIEKGIDLGHLRAMIVTGGGLTQKEGDEAQSAAMAATKAAPGSTILENMAAVLDLKNVTGSLKEGEDSLPAFAKLSTMLQLVDRQKGGSGDPAFAAAKAMEIMGEMVDEKTDARTGKVTRDISPDRLMSRLDMLAKVVVATNGRVSPQDYLRFAKSGEVPGMLMSDEFKYQQLPAMLMTMGSSRVGTMFTSIDQVFQQPHMTEKTYDQLVKAGLADPGKWVEERNPKNGKMVKSRTNEGVYDLPLLATNPLEWMQKAVERMDAAGIHGTENQIRALENGSQRSTIGRMLADLLKDMPAIFKEQRNIQSVPDNVFDKFKDADPAAHVQQFSAAWENLLTVLGSKGMDHAISLLDNLTGALNGLSNYFDKHSDLATAAVDLTGTLGAVAAGIAALTTANYFLLKPLRSVIDVIGKITGLASNVDKAASTAETAAKVAAGAAGIGAGTAVVGGAAVVTAAGALAASNTANYGLNASIGTTFGVPTMPFMPDPYAPGGDAHTQAQAKAVGDAVKSSLDGATVNLNGEAVGTLVTKAQDKAAQRPPTSTGNIDTSSYPMFPTTGGQ